MREVEFLPAWYPQIRRRRRLVVLQGWLSFVAVVGMGLWMTIAQRNLSAATSMLAQVDGDLTRSRTELKEVEELETLNKKLGEQAQILSKVGNHVEAARLLVTLDEVMPKTMTLLELSFLTEEQVPLTLADARLTQQQKERTVERRLNVKVAGVAPTDVEVAEFLTRLTGKPYFEDVRMTRSKPRPDKGRLMREFEVYFSMDLNDPAGT